MVIQLFYQTKQLIILLQWTPLTSIDCWHCRLRSGQSTLENSSWGCGRRARTMWGELVGPEAPTKLIGSSGAQGNLCGQKGHKLNQVCVLLYMLLLSCYFFPVLFHMWTSCSLELALITAMIVSHDLSVIDPFCKFPNIRCMWSCFYSSSDRYYRQVYCRW